MTRSTARGSLPGVDRARLAQDVTLGVHHAGGHLGAANIDADGKPPPAQPELLPEQAVAGQPAVLRLSTPRR